MQVNRQTLLATNFKNSRFLSDREPERSRLSISPLTYFLVMSCRGDGSMGHQPTKGSE